MCCRLNHLGFGLEPEEEEIFMETTKKQITLSVEEAREMLGQSSAIDKMIHANFTEEELRPLVKSFQNLDEISGFFIGLHSNIMPVEKVKAISENKNVFATQNQAKGVLAMAQLSQLMKDVRGDWKSDFADSGSLKYCIRQIGNVTEAVDFYRLNHFLAFPTPKIRDQFLNDHRELIEEYFLIYKH